LDKFLIFRASEFFGDGETVLEVCVETAEAAELAWRNGAGRIELCSALEVGGVTPSPGLVSTTMELIECPLIVLVRPRAGDFVYSSLENRASLRDIERLMDIPTVGFAVGGLNAANELDYPYLEQVSEIAHGRELVMHRAFDLVTDKAAALEQLVRLGFRRILTSGGPVKAIDGIDQLRMLIQLARDRIEILPAGGICVDNFQQVLDRSLCNQLHGSFGLQQHGSAKSRWGQFSTPDPHQIRQVSTQMATRRNS
jgi:copper homeostasis protein